jgi:hypothetical protein
LHLDVSTLQRPLQLLDVSIRHRGLSCTWTCLESEACAAPWLLDSLTSTLQRPLMHFDVSTLYRPVLVLELSTQQYKCLSCTWTCLDSSSLSYCYWGVYTTGPDGRVCTTESCAAPGRVSSSGSSVQLLDLFTLQRPALHSDLSTHWGLSFTRICLHYGVLCCFRSCLHTGAWASAGRVCTTEHCAALCGVWGLSFTRFLCHLWQCFRNVVNIETKTNECIDN